MSTVKAFLTRHAVPTYFALAFAVSWAGVLLVVSLGGIPGTVERFMTVGPFMYLAMLAGPSVAGLLITGLVSGRVGFRELLARLLKWRVGGRWYAVALLTAPFLACGGRRLASSIRTGGSSRTGTWPLMAVH